MPTVYLLELRWRVVWFYTAHGLSATDISKQLCISESTVRRYINVFEQTHEVELKTQQHRPTKLLGDLQQLVVLRVMFENTSRRSKQSYWPYLVSLSVLQLYARH